MIIRLFVRTIKLFVFCCILLYTLFFLNKLFDLEVNAPAINNFLAAIAAIPIPGVETVGGVVVLIVGGLTLQVKNFDNFKKYSYIVTMIDIRDTDYYKEKIMQKECILLNKIFEGSYTDNISNIPHEIIDFFKADDGKYYVYNNPFGDFGNHNKNYTPTYLLLTSSYIPKEKKVKIFYLIKIKEKIHNFGYDRKALANFENSNNKDNQKNVIEKIIKKNISYGGQRLDKIYEENDKTYMLTFEAEWIREPKEEMFFEFNTGYNFQRNTGIVHNDEQKQAETFKRLMEKIEDSKLWKSYKLDKINSEDVTNYKNPEKAGQKTFLDFICMIEREECYTNFLFNLFSENKELVKNFLMLHPLKRQG